MYLTRTAVRATLDFQSPPEKTKAAGWGARAALNNDFRLNTTLPHTSPQGRKLPPYGQALAKALETNTLREVWIFVGDAAWSHVTRPAADGRTLLPPGESPSVFRWPVDGLEVLAIQAGAVTEAALLELRDNLLNNGATVVRILAEDEAGASYLTTHRPVSEVRHVA